MSFEYMGIVYLLTYVMACRWSQNDKYFLRLESTSDQSDESDLLKFVQNQIHTKQWT